MLLLVETLCSNFLNYPCQSVFVCFFFSSLKMLQNSLKTRWIFLLITIVIFVKYRYDSSAPDGVSGKPNFK